MNLGLSEIPRKIVPILGTIVLLLGTFAAGHFLWPVPPDPRAGSWLAADAQRRASQKAFDHDTAVAWDQVRIAQQVSARTHNVGRATVGAVISRLDSLATDSLFVRDCPQVIDLRDTLRVAVLMYDSARTADSSRIAAQQRIIVTLEDRLRSADSLIASARPIIQDAKRRHGWRTDAVLVVVTAAAVLVLR